MAKGKAHQGAGLARAIRDVVVEGMAKYRAGILPHEQAARWRATDAHLESLEQELAPLMGKVFGEIHADPACPPELRAILDEVIDPQHPTGFLVDVVALLGSVLAILPALGQANVRQYLNGFNTGHRTAYMSPADAASGVARGIIDYNTADGYAATYGYSTDSFADLVKLSGEPPGPVDLLSLWRRGLIDQNFLESAIKYSRIHDDYIPAILDLAHSYMTPSDVIELAIKGLVTTDTGATMFGVAGGIPEQFDLLFEGAGDAIGNEQALHLYNQGLATQADVYSVFGRSRMNPIFYPLAFELRHRFLEPYQIIEVVKAGGTDEATAVQWMINLGFGADQAHAVVAAGSGTKAAKVKSETEAMVGELYAERVITSAEAEAELAKLGYDAGTAGMLVELWDAKVALSQQRTAIGGVRAAMVAGAITPTKASADLDQLGVPAAARDQWLKAWEIEQGTKVKRLTTAQVGTMAKDGIVTYETAMKFWGDEGYSEIETQLLAARYGGGPLIDAATGNPVTYNGVI